MTTTNPTPTQQETLLPCPFCGVVPAMQSHTQEDEMDEGRYVFFVECGNRQCPMGLVSTGGPFKEAAKAAGQWNTRALQEQAWKIQIQPSDSARRAAEEISSTFGLKFQEASLQHAAAIISKHFAATPSSEASTRLRAFFNDDYTLVARHFKDTTKDRDITGDVEDLLNAAAAIAGRVVNVNAHGEPTRLRLQEIENISKQRL